MLMTASDLPLKRIARGKVRDVYEVDGDRLLLVATDRVSAYDVVMAEPIPMKGAVLTQTSAWWFRQLGAVVRHHMISAEAEEIIIQGFFEPVISEVPSPVVQDRLRNFIEEKLKQ